MTKTHRYRDILGPEFNRDPAAVIARLRGEGPLVRVRLPIIGPVWMTTTREMAERVLKDDGTFAMRGRDGGVAGLQWWMPGIFRTLAQNMLTMDEPDHHRLRAIVDEAFRRRAVLDMEPRIRAIADKLADGLFARGDTADIVDGYARRLPLAVIVELLGLPAGDHSRFTGWANAITMVDGLPGFLRMVPALGAMRRYLERQIADIRQRGGDGLIGELVRAQAGGADISDEEVVAMVFLLLFAGHETTTHLISGSVFEMVQSACLAAWLREDAGRAALATEEFLRFVSPVQMSKPRIVRADVTLGGVTLKTGDRVMVMIAAANMDPAANEHPETLDPERKPNRHIAFGTGIHFCLGHQLARIEGRCALAALMERWPRLTLAVDPDEIRWRKRAGLRAIVKLPVVPGEV